MNEQNKVANKVANEVVANEVAAMTRRSLY